MHAKGFVINQVNVGLHIKKNRKFLQFVIIFHLPQQGHPFMNHDNMWQLFVFVKMSSNLRHHWNDSNVWIMDECMHKIAFVTNTWMVILKTRFIFISIREVTTVDYQSWLGVHGYFVDD
jgi:hypothetical protein